MQKIVVAGAPWIRARRLLILVGMSAVVIGGGVLTGVAHALTVSRVEVVGDTTQFYVDGCHGVSGASLKLPEGTRRIAPLDPAPGATLRHDGRDVAEVTKVELARRGGMPTALFAARPLLPCSREVPSEPEYCGEGILCPHQPPPRMTPEPPAFRLNQVRVEVKAFIHGDFQVYARLPGSGANVVRPRRLALTADGAVYLTDLQWASWGGRTATGTGRLYVNSCDPFCAAERFESRRARVELARPEFFGERYHYTRLSIKVLGSAIAGFHPSRFRKL